MSLAAILLSAAAPASAPPPENEIVVVARRLETWRGKLVANRGTFRCKTTRSTGDRAIDAIGCQALMTCLAPIQDELAAVSRADIARAEKRRQLDAMVQAQVPCLEETRRQGIAALAESR